MLILTCKGGIVMAGFMKKFRKIERRFNKKTEWLAERYPRISLFVAMILVPVLILAFVCLGTMVIVFPIAWILGII